MERSKRWQEEVDKWSKKREESLENLERETEETAIEVGGIIAEHVLKCNYCFVYVCANDGAIKIKIAGKEVSIAGTVYEQREAEATQQFLTEIGFLCDEFEKGHMDHENWWEAEVKLAEKVPYKGL